MARSTARESAMRLLYGRELGGDSIEECLQDLMEVTLSEEDQAYLLAMLDGVNEKQNSLDELIAQHAIGWSLDRIAKVDLSILRLALYEMLNRDDIPVSVSINEAVELCHEYSGPEAASFVNGILGTVARGLDD